VPHRPVPEEDSHSTDGDSQDGPKGLSFSGINCRPRITQRREPKGPMPEMDGRPQLVDSLVRGAVAGAKTVVTAGRQRTQASSAVNKGPFLHIDSNAVAGRIGVSWDAFLDEQLAR
jgi:hypothetical protein